MNKSLSSVWFFGLTMLFGCSIKQEEEKHNAEWKFIKEISLDNISPVGLAIQDSFIWLPDVDNNRIVKIDLNGNILEEYDEFERPMHIALSGNEIYIPEYTKDTLRILNNGTVTTYPLAELTNAIAAVAVDGKTIAIADFYNHRIILQQGDEASVIGKEGHNDGELYYPTDLALYDSLIYVADAYNNRIQVFDYYGNYVRMIGWNEGIKVATGLKVTESHVFVSDFDGNRILIFNHDGMLIQILKQTLNKPADIEIEGNNMYIVNYAGSISIYKLLP